MPRSSSSNQPKVALIGYGYWGRNLARNLHHLGALAIVCDCDASALETARADLDGVKFSDDFESTLKNANVKGVVIATPAATHFELGMKALAAEKDVLVEKPLALDLAEARKMVDLAETQKRILMCGHLLHYHPAVRRMKQIIASGDLGEIRYVAATRLNFGKIRWEESVLWSFAPHDLSLLLSILGERPSSVSSVGGAFLDDRVADVTTTFLSFPNGAKAHVFISWLHPFKEQKFVVVGERKTIVFDDTELQNKLMLFDSDIHWEGGRPILSKSDGTPVKCADEEPLANQCIQFLRSILTREPPITNGREALSVVAVLRDCQRSLENSMDFERKLKPECDDIKIHQSAEVEDGVEIGEGTQVWRFSHIRGPACIGRNCRIGQNVTIGPNASVGDGVKIQNNVSVFEGVILEEGVFCGPSVVFTNVRHPRSRFPKTDCFEKTIVRRHATLGANCVIVCGIEIGEYSFVGAGAVVVKSVRPYALMLGNPAKQAGWVGRHGVRLEKRESDNVLVCPESGWAYQVNGTDQSLELLEGEEV